MRCSPPGTLLLQTPIHVWLGSYISLRQVLSSTCPTSLLHSPTLIILSVICFETVFRSFFPADYNVSSPGGPAPLSTPYTNCLGSVGLRQLNQYSSIRVMRGFTDIPPLFGQKQRGSKCSLLITRVMGRLLHVAVSLWEIPAQPPCGVVAVRFMEQLLFDGAFIDLCHHQPVNFSFPN